MLIRGGTNLHKLALRRSCPRELWSVNLQYTGYACRCFRGMPSDAGSIPAASTNDSRGLDMQANPFSFARYENEGDVMRKLNPEYLEAVKPVVNRSPFFALLGMSLRDVGMGSSILEIDVRKKHIQPFGAVHGGVFASIIDASAFWAVYSEVDEHVGMTTVDLKVNYLAPARSGKLIAKGRRIKLGKTLGLGEAQVINEENTILAHGTSILIILPNLKASFAVSLPPKFIEQE
jgi:uncharacterized protein (TIGR00369 family)